MLESLSDKIEISQSKHYALDDALRIDGPFRVEKAPNAYSFRRSRLVDFPWEEICKELIQEGLTLDNYESQIKAYLLVNWDAGKTDSPPEEVLEENIFDLTNDWPSFVHDPEQVEISVWKDSSGNRPRGFFMFKKRKVKYCQIPHSLASVDVNQGCAFRVRTNSGFRWYQPLVEKKVGEVTYPSKAEFKADWKNTWKEISSLRQVYYPGSKPEEEKEAKNKRKEAESDARNFFPVTELIRADAALIHRQYKYLKHEAVIANKLENNAGEIAKQLEQADPQLIPTIAKQYRQLMGYRDDIDAKKKALADAASDLGYKLFIENTDFVCWDETGAEKTEKIKAGELYLKSRKSVSWTTYHEVNRTLGSPNRRAVHHEKTFDFYEEAKFDSDPWVEATEFFKTNGYNVYLFRETKDGLRSSDNSGPGEILEKCSKDEEFRRSCVIALPFYEITIIGEEFLVGYQFLIRPVPEIVPVEFPEIYVEEDLSYRYAWTGTALGELAATIPLSPGEEREVTLSTEQKYESRKAQTTKSLMEISRIDKSDFETVFEKEVRKEKEKTSSGSANVGGSYGPVSGSAKVSKTSKTKDVARQLNRSVQRASQEVNRKSREERKIEISEKVDTTARSTTTYNVRNINSGSTLNVAFYRLYNSFTSMLQVEDFNISTLTGLSFLAGSEGREKKTFSRTDFASLIKSLLAPMSGPVNLTALLEEGNENALCKFVLKLRLAISESHDMESNQGGKDNEHITAITRSVLSKLSNVRDFLSNGDESEGKSMVEVFNENKANFDELDDTYARYEFNDKELVTHFAYDSGGLYCDVYRGHNPATDSYSEGMRLLEQKRTTAEIRKLRADALKVEGEALSVRDLLPAIDISKVYTTAVQVLIEPDDHTYLHMQLVPTGFPADGWVAVFANGLGNFSQILPEANSVLTFVLPRRFATQHKIQEWSEEKFAEKLKLKHPAYDIQINYKASVLN